MVERIEVRKGGLDPRDGNLATAGAIDLRTRDRVEEPNAWIRGASVGSLTFGGLLPIRRSFGGGGYLALGGRTSDGPFERSEDFRQANAFLRWARPISSRVGLAITASSFASRWDASGQIPDRAVRNGSISRFGAIDPSEGGRTDRSDVWVTLTSRQERSEAWRLIAYATRYRLDLFSNFTFFAADSVAGDGIAQLDRRWLAGFRGDLDLPVTLAGFLGRLTAGIALRSDFADLLLADQTDRRLRRERIGSRVSEQNAAAWLGQRLRVGSRLDLDLGLRGDLFRFAVGDRSGGGPSGAEWAGRISPKIGARMLASGLKIRASAGASFHSNDARVVVAADSMPTLPRATTLEVGVRRELPWGSAGLALWRADLASELIFVGDEGTTDAGGRTRRRGLDLETRMRLFRWLWGDFDLSLVTGRLRDEPAGADAIPLAPRRTVAAGLTARGEDPGPRRFGSGISTTGRPTSGARSSR